VNFERIELQGGLSTSTDAIRRDPETKGMLLVGYCGRDGGKKWSEVDR
jgi:hypothetical protein